MSTEEAIKLGVIAGLNAYTAMARPEYVSENIARKTYKGAFELWKKNNMLTIVANGKRKAYLRQQLDTLWQAYLFGKTANK